LPLAVDDAADTVRVEVAVWPEESITSGGLNKIVGAPVLGRTTTTESFTSPENPFRLFSLIVESPLPPV
jgi:hypothetical protein